jgi:hypothetical protein
MSSRAGQGWQEIGQIGNLYARRAAVAVEEILQAAHGHIRHEDSPQADQFVCSDAAFHDCRRE